MMRCGRNERVWNRSLKSSSIDGRSRLVLLSLVAFVGTLNPVLAQGCAMCKTNLSAQTDNVVSSLQSGIVILLIPPLLLMSAILLVAFRRDSGDIDQAPNE